MSTSMSTSSIRGPYRTKVKTHKETSSPENKKLYNRLSHFSEILKTEHPPSSTRSYILEELQRFRDRIQKAINRDLKEQETTKIHINELTSKIEEQQKEIEELKRQQNQNQFNDINFEFDF